MVPPRGKTRQTKAILSFESIRFCSLGEIQAENPSLFAFCALPFPVRVDDFKQSLVEKETASFELYLHYVAEVLVHFA